MRESALQKMEMHWCGREIIKRGRGRGKREDFSAAISVGTRIRSNDRAIGCAPRSHVLYESWEGMCVLTSVWGEIGPGYCGLVA